MSDKFNGFSRDEIIKISGAIKNPKKTSTEAMKQQGIVRNHQGLRRMSDKPIKQTDPFPKLQRVAASKQPAQKANTNKDEISNKNYDKNEQLIEPDDTININCSMSKSLEEALYFGQLIDKNNHDNKKITPVPDQENTSADSSILKISASTLNNNINVNNNNNINNNSNGKISNCSTNSSNDTSILPSTPKDCQTRQNNLDTQYKGISLREFEAHRRMIEEQNKTKKDLLYKAIEQHTQKTAAETKKIQDIRHELSKLESDLAVDVAILRKQIDNACVHFANVEKQYLKIESQFLKAKMDLHNATEKKQLLTEHLCTVITHNEDRKAKKLSELMQKVGLVANDDYVAPISSEN